MWNMEQNGKSYRSIQVVMADLEVSYIDEFTYLCRRASEASNAFSNLYSDALSQSEMPKQSTINRDYTDGEDDSAEMEFNFMESGQEEKE